jgi:hypothetical protein
MIIIRPIETLLGLLWEDFKENPKEWIVFLCWTVPTDIAWDLTLWALEKVRDRYRHRSNLSD